jgi:hypothetical protein
MGMLIDAYELKLGAPDKSDVYINSNSSIDSQRKERGDWIYKEYP